jgi:hypothetical protein
MLTDQFNDFLCHSSELFGALCAIFSVKFIISGLVRNHWITMNLILHSYSYVQIHNNIGNLKRKAVKVTAIFEGKIKK